jgi:hypothetical protein
MIFFVMAFSAPPGLSLAKKRASPVRPPLDMISNFLRMAYHRPAAHHPRLARGPKSGVFPKKFEGAAGAEALLQYVERADGLRSDRNGNATGPECDPGDPGSL